MSLNAIFYSFQLMYNMLSNEMPSKQQSAEKHRPQSISFATFMLEKMLRKKSKFESVDINDRANNNKGEKIFTASCQDSNSIYSKIRSNMQRYKDQFSKSEEKVVQQKKDDREKFMKRKYRIKTFTSLQQNEDKISPLIMKFMKLALKSSVSETPSFVEGGQQVYGLNIQQAKTYKILNKKEAIKIKYPTFESESIDNTDSTIISKLSNSVKGGGFNIKQVRRWSKNVQEKDEETKQFFDATLYKKQQTPKRYLIQSKQKRQNISINDLKFNKMIMVLDIILNSFHLYIERPPRDSQTLIINSTQQKTTKKQGNKFTFYIGRGNNSELIRSIIKKRNWWAETNSPLNSNLIWSQVKIKRVIEKHPSLSKQDMDKKGNPEKHIKNKSLNNLANYTKIFSKSESPFGLNESAYHSLFHEAQGRKYYLQLSESQKKKKMRRISVPELYHNHFEFNYILGNKNALYFNLLNYCRVAGLDIWNIMPLTYYLQSNSQNAIKQFLDKFEELAGENHIWILKPGENSNRGQRITLGRTLSEIKEKLAIEQKLIVQSYVKDLLLFNGRKFDIRAYMLGVNLHGRLKFYFYQEGYLKTSSFAYSLKNINDRYVHLTNDAVQQNSEKYGKYEQGNKLSYAQFQRYLDNKYPEQKYSMLELHKIMRSYASEAVRSSCHRLNGNNKQFCFQLFGLDFLVDSAFKPYLLQVNTNPCLQLSSSSLERLIPRMLENLFRLCVDPLFRPQLGNNTKSQSYYFYDNSFLQKNQFRLIFDSNYDCNPQWQNLSYDLERECNFQQQKAEEDAFQVQ